MKKILIYILLLLVILPLTVHAEQLCIKKVYEELAAKVNEVEIKMTEKDDQIEVEVTNVDKDLMIYYNGNTYEPIDGKVTIIMDKTTNNYDLKFYGGYDHACVEEYIATKRLYNKYSEKDECNGNEEWELCQKEYDGYIKDDEEFEEKLNEYLKSDEKKEIESEKKNNKQKFILITLLVIIIFGICGYKINNNKKNKKGKSE
ncbi:MAG: hypothetical protein IJ568_01840 [Bacilli bacterium]|nr:hypothetical protein [Bacilli bacterium]